MSPFKQRLKAFLKFNDERFEDLRGPDVGRVIYRDFSAGLIVALTAIPMAMGFAMASGLRPEQGIIAGAVACLVGRTFGGSKYQVYGPTAAFIPLIASMAANYNHAFIVAASVIAGAILMILGLLGWGRVAKKVPNSIVVGFTAGIAVAIAGSHLGDALGVVFAKGSSFGDKLAVVGHGINGFALTIALGTFLMCRYLMQVSIYIPAPLIALGLGTLVANTAWKGKGIQLVADRFGRIPSDFFVFTPPALPTITGPVLFDLAYYVFAIVFISGVESLLCSSMADKLAHNKKTPFNADKEFWGQGLVQIITPLINGFPCTGALARTATSIKAGAMTPLAGYFKGVLKLMLAVAIAQYLEMVPLACIAGILFWVATNMIKPSEIRYEFKEGALSAALVVYTAIMVPATDFLSGVLSALILYFIALSVQKVRGVGK